MEVGGVIKISDDSDSDSDEVDSESNSSPESLQDNDDVIFVNHINGPAGKFPYRGHDIRMQTSEFFLLIHMSLCWKSIGPTA